MEQQILIRYLARAFVRGLQADATAQGYANFASAIGDGSLVPRPVFEIASTGPVQRVALGTMTGDWVVQTTGESVDIQSSPQFGTAPIPFDEFCAKAGAQLSAALDFFGAPSWRLAVVREWIFRELGEAELRSCRARLHNLPAGAPEPFEWDWRTGSSVDRTVVTSPVRTNTISTIKRVEIAVPGRPEHDRLWFSTDVNTSPKESRARFGAAEVAAFCNLSPEWHAELELGMLHLAALQ